uniref:Uncharacterized protein n=1 Tax=Solanum lycopersicum TaxID=4081 RepID=A0A3Q7FCW9_SOLLC
MKQYTTGGVGEIVKLRFLITARYNPNRYQDEDDTSDMEANFDDILREEKRSASNLTLSTLSSRGRHKYELNPRDKSSNSRLLQV